MVEETEEPGVAQFAAALAASKLEANAVDFPRRDLRGRPIAQCRIEVLTCAQVDAVRIAEAKRLIASGVTADSVGDVLWEIVCADRVARACLAMALRGVKPIDGSDAYPQLFASGDALARDLAHEEVEQLLEHYIATQGLEHLRQEGEADATAAA